MPPHGVLQRVCSRLAMQRGLECIDGNAILRRGSRHREVQDASCRESEGVPQISSFLSPKIGGQGVESVSVEHSRRFARTEGRWKG